MFSLIVPTVLAAMPAGYELDYRALPPAKTGRFREFVIILSFKGEPDVKIPCGYAAEYGPKETTDSFMGCLDDPRWRIRQNGARVTIFGYDDVRIEKVTVEGKGPKPAVRRVLGIPPEWKK